MAPAACGEPSSTGITGVPATIIKYHLVSPQKSRHRCAVLCLGESPAQARLKCLDLCCSFETLVKAEYGGHDPLDFAAQNYIENVRREESGIRGITYERALQNLVVAMYGHYVDLFRCHSSMAGHRIVLAYNCLEVATKLGCYHWAVWRRQPGEELPDWIPTPEIPAGDSRLDYVDAFTLLGNAMHPAYGHPKTLAQAYDQVYYEGREMGNLPLRGKKMADQSTAVYRAEYAQIVHRFSTLTWIDCEKFVRLMPTSLVHPEMVFPDKKYEAYCLKVLESEPVVQYEPISDYKMDGLQPRVDLRLGTEIPGHPEDEVDADPCFNEYPPSEEFMEGPEWTPGGIPPKIHSPEYSGNTSDTSIDTQAARTIQAVSVTANPEPGGAVASTSAGQDTRRVELTPLPGLTQQFTIQVEWEIQKQIQECSRQLVQDVMQRSANWIMPPTPSEAAWASLSQCFQKALATPQTEPAPPLEQPRGQTKGESAQYSLADPFVGINPPLPEVLKESYSDHPARGRAATHLEWPPEEKKRRSSSRLWGEAEPKRGWSSGAEPSWDVSKVGGRQSDKACSQPTSEPEAPAHPLKLKSAVKSVRLNLPKPEDLESLGPAAWSRYDDSAKDDWPWRNSSQNRADAHDKPRSSTVKSSGHSNRGSGRHDRRSGQSPNPRSSKHKEESMGAKLMARKEREKRYKKIVDNPILYLEERRHQILPEEHQLEIHSLGFFGSGVEGAAIEVLALIDWAAEYVEISRSPVPEIPGFLRRPFIKGKLVKHPIPDDPAESIHKEKCVRTQVQKAWTYLCALLQFWTDEATTESGEVMYRGWRRPANPMIARIRATLNLSFGDHFKITWASIAASTSWTQSRLYYGESDRERFRTEPGPTADLQNPLEAAVEERWERYLKEGVLETADLSFSTPSWAGAASRPLLLSGQPEARHPTEADSVPPGFTRIN